MSSTQAVCQPSYQIAHVASSCTRRCSANYIAKGWEKNICEQTNCSLKMCVSETELWVYFQQKGRKESIWANTCTEKYNQTLFRINHATTFLTTNYWPNREFNKSLIEHSLEFTGICAMQFWSVVHEVLAQQSSPSDIFLKRWSMSQNILRTTELNYLLI